jgi:hypothetical protein
VLASAPLTLSGCLNSPCYQRTRHLSVRPSDRFPISFDPHDNSARLFCKKFRLYIPLFSPRAFSCPTLTVPDQMGGRASTEPRLKRQGLLSRRAGGALAVPKRSNIAKLANSCRRHNRGCSAASTLAARRDSAPFIRTTISELAPRSN